MTSTPPLASLQSGADPVGERHEAALEIAAAAGRTARRYFERRETLVIDQKSSLQDVVSEADRQVETEIRAAVAARFPDDGLIGEEHGAASGTSGYIWVIDPIDGTSPFLCGQPNWCVSIGLAGPEGIVAGVVHAPVPAETYAARRGHGAFLNGRRLAVDQGANIASSPVAFGASTKIDPAEVGAFVEALYREGGVMFQNGSGALMLCYVAAGRLAGYYDPLINAWDCYAGLVLVEEAGGTAVFEGSLHESGPLYAGPARVADDLMRLAAATRRR